MRLGPDLAVPLDVHVDSNNTNHLSNDEGEGTKVERPPIGIALLGVALPGVPRIGRDVNYDPYDVAEP